MKGGVGADTCSWEERERLPNDNPKGAFLLVSSETGVYIFRG